MKLIKTIDVHKDCMINNDNPTPSKETCFTILINITACDHDKIIDYHKKQKLSKIKIHHKKDEPLRKKQFVHFVMSGWDGQSCCERFTMTNYVPFGQHFITKIELYEDEVKHDESLYHDKDQKIIARVYFSETEFYDAICRNIQNGYYSHEIEIDVDLNTDDYNVIYKRI